MSEPTKKALSPTQLDMYARCGESYRRRYIMGEKIPPGIAALKGRSVHRGAEHNWKQKIESRVDLPAKDIIETTADSFEQEKKGGFILTKEEESVGLQKTLGQVKDRAVILSGLFSKAVAPLYQPVMVEQTFKIEIPAAPFDISGRIDMLDDRNYVPDLKTSGKRKNQSEVDSSIQLTTYSAGATSLTGKPAPGVGFDVLVDTKIPQLQRLSSTRTKPDFMALVNRVNAVTAGIQAGVFSPAVPGAWNCDPKWCGFWNSCQFVNSERKAAAEANG